jgi:hypothetical protein
VKGRLATLLLGGLVACGGEPVDTTWHQESGYRWRQLDVSARGRTGLRQMPPSTTGITHRNDVADERAIYNRQLLTGAGVAAGDIDGDGLPDLFFAAVEKPGTLYRNAGNFRFTDITASSGIDTRDLATTSAMFADVNDDGHLDLVVGTLGGPLKLWRGDGTGHFTDATASSGLIGGYAASTMTMADVDGDGDLDLYVGTYKTKNALDVYTPQQRAFEQVVKKIGDEYQVVDQWKREFRIEDHPELGGIVRSQRAEPDLFFVNDGAGRFTRVPQTGPRWRDESGRPLAQEPDYFTLASRFYDVNNDGAPDLYVCNDFEDPDQFWLNDGKGNFRLTPWLSMRETSNTCMSVDFGDVNRDGHVDFFTADMMSPTLAQRQRQFPTHTPLPKRVGLSNDRQQWMRNMLQVSRGDGTWASVGDFAGVSGTDWTWGSAFLDVDLDGYEDLLALNGHRWDVRDADTFERIRNSFPRVPWNREQGEFPKSATRNAAFRNNGDLTFADMSRTWGFGADEAISHGIALADLDGDGDLDVIATRLNGPPAVYRNEAPAGRIAVRVAADSGATRSAAVGAKVSVKVASLPAQEREVTAGGYYLSSSDPLLAFAAGADSAAQISVRWRDGSVTTIGDARANRLYEISPSNATRASATVTAAPSLFEDATLLLGGHMHVDSAFDDYARQPLLPHKFSQLGPGVTWTDMDADGRVDLVVGTGAGGSATLLRNTGGRFVPSPLGATAKLDLTTILPVPNGRGGSFLLAGQSNYEAMSPAQALSVTDVIPLTPGGPPIKGDTASVGPLALADVNGDGLLDLFVGARVVPTVWPRPARSHLFLRRADGGWARDTANERALGALGLVSAALLTDLDGDGRPELVVTAEWGPVRVLHNVNGRFRDVTGEWGLSGTTSRWNGLSAGDFDGDGKLDLIVTSWGRNQSVRASRFRPHVLIAGNFGGQGLGLVLAQLDSASGKEMPLETFARIGIAVPSAKERIASFTAYATSTVDQVLGEHAAAGVRVGATTYDHLILMNRGSRFEARSLPDVAQLAPAFAPVVADFDGDGNEDVFLAQNFSPTEIETPRLDAGQGLMLLGDGKGQFTVLPPVATVQSPASSGIRVLGDQRGAAAADYDGDGRVDLAVSQNGAATTLWHNRGAIPGFRIRVDAGPNNPLGIGAQLRLVGEGGAMGPVREIRAGSAYWSMDDPTSVLAGTSVTAVWVRLPGGRIVSAQVGIGQRSVTIR